MNEIGKNLIAAGKINRELGKRLLESQFIKHGIDTSNIYTFSGMKFINPFEYKSGICGQIYHGIGKVIGVNTSNWDRRVDDEIQKVNEVVRILFNK